MVAVTFSEADIRRTADSTSFVRGQGYRAGGRVRELSVTESTATAVVDGGRRYRVELAYSGSRLVGKCDCPMGAEGVFCKHCVASALLWLELSDDETEAVVADPAASESTDSDLRAFLLGQDPQRLVDELLRASEGDPLLRARLEVAAGTAARDAYDDWELRTLLERAIEIRDFVSYHDAEGYFRDIDEALDAVDDLIDEGFPDAAVGLTEYALDLLEASAGLVDDSGGGLGVALGRAEEIHLEACFAGEPDPVALAERLAQRGLTSGYEVFLEVLPAYADVFGEAGMARYRELVEDAWQNLPPIRQGEHQPGRFQITHLMERVAECEGGADAYIAVLARDVNRPYDVWRIAQRLCADGRDAEALEWLDRGMSDFPPDDRLRSLAAECHLRGGRRDEALEMLWANFAGRPSLPTYQALREAAGDTPAPWRNRALELLRAQPPAPRGFTGPSYIEHEGHSTLVEVLLWEGDVESAWDAAQTGGCRRGLWLQVGRERAKTHPADAIPIVTEAAEQAIETKNRSAYRDAAKLLAEVRTLARRSGDEDDFRSYLRQLRAKHKAKWALQQELDRSRLA